MDRGGWGGGGGFVSYVSVMRLNFALDTASANTASQLRRGFPLVGGAVDHRPPPTNKLDCLPVSSTFYAFLFSHLFIF